jgi:hypothetical protein
MVYIWMYIEMKIKLFFSITAKNDRVCTTQSWNKSALALFEQKWAFAWDFLWCKVRINKRFWQSRRIRKATSRRIHTDSYMSVKWFWQKLQRDFLSSLRASCFIIRYTHNFGMNNRSIFSIFILLRIWTLPTDSHIQMFILAYVHI